jgi:protein-tyrosine phosphatase
MTAAAIKRGVRLTSRSRPLRPEDFRRFQYVVGMDANNIRAILVGGTPAATLLSGAAERTK